jgi:hypothetical protein
MGILAGLWIPAAIIASGRSRKGCASESETKSSGWGQRAMAVENYFQNLIPMARTVLQFARDLARGRRPGPQAVGALPVLPVTVMEMPVTGR